MKKNILRTLVICLAFLFIMGTMTISGITDEPGPIGSITETAYFM